jgi:hypothetical protein
VRLQLVEEGVRGGDLDPEVDRRDFRLAVLLAARVDVDEEGGGGVEEGELFMGWLSERGGRTVVDLGEDSIALDAGVVEFARVFERLGAGPLLQAVSHRRGGCRQPRLGLVGHAHAALGGGDLGLALGLARSASRSRSACSARWRASSACRASASRRATSASLAAIWASRRAFSARWAASASASAWRWRSRSAASSASRRSCSARSAAPGGRLALLLKEELPLALDLGLLRLDPLLVGDPVVQGAEGRLLRFLGLDLQVAVRVVDRLGGDPVVHRHELGRRSGAPRAPAGT